MYEAKLRESKWTKNEKIVCDGDDDGRGSNKKPTQKYNNIQCVACKKKTRCHTHRKEKRKRAIRATDDVLCTPSPCQCIWCGLLSVIQSNRKCIVMYKYRKIVSRVRARAHTPKAIIISYCCFSGRSPFSNNNNNIRCSDYMRKNWQCMHHMELNIPLI